MQHVFVARHLFSLQSRGYGAMLITASAADSHTNRFLTLRRDKHAAVSVAEWLQIAHRSDNIRISCLCPQAVKTGIVPEGGAAAWLLVTEHESVVQRSPFKYYPGRVSRTSHKKVRCTCNARLLITIDG